MFTTNLETFKTQEKELHLQAAHYRLTKSLEQKNSLVNRINRSLGRMLIHTGQQLIDGTRAAAH